MRGTCTVKAGRALCILFSMHASEPEMSERSHAENRVIQMLFQQRGPYTRDFLHIRGPLPAGASRNMVGRS